MIAAERPELDQAEREYLAMRLIHTILKHETKGKRKTANRGPDAATVLAWSNASRSEQE